MSNFAKPIWLSLLLTLLIAVPAQSDDQSPTWGPVCRGNSQDSAGCVSPPKPIYTPDPELDEASRKAKLTGTVVLQITVTKEGTVQDPKIKRSASEVMDKKAIEAVLTWKFDPAKKDGKPVPLYLVIEVAFNSD